MSKISVILNWFNKEEPSETNVEVEIKVDKETTQETFDDAVQKVLNNNLRESLKKQLKEMCYPEEVIKQTKDAIKDQELYLELTIDELCVKYPKASKEFYGRFTNIYLGLPFNLDLFIDRLLENTYE